VLTDLSNHPLFAATPALNLDVLNGIVETFKNQAKLWEKTLSGLATSLFVTLAIIELVWVIGWATARRTGFDDMVALVAEQIIIIGFFYWLMINTADFILAIIDSFAEAANQASIAGGGSKNLGPSDIFAAGLNMSKTLLEGMTVFDIPFSMLLCLAGIINIIIFAKITAKLIEVLIESSFTAYAGIILMGFGGTRFTRDYATSVFRYGISVGVKRLFLQLIIGLGQGIIVGWVSTLKTGGVLNWQTIGIMMGAPLIMYGLAETLPQKAQDLIMGVYTGGSGASVGKPVAMAAAAVGGALAGAVGGGAAVKAAFQLARTQLDQRQRSGQGGQSGTAATRMGRAAQLTGMAARNIGSAAASDIGKRLSGTGGRYGHRSWRIASDMKNQAGQNSQSGQTSQTSQTSQRRGP
jgi:type IV secretion system protein TrbL